MSLPVKPKGAEPLPTTPVPTLVRPWYARWLLRALAVTSLGLGIAGVFIPGLPTTVFILIAGWAAMRSSPRMHAWLWNHTLFGPMLQNWAAGGFVSRRAKRSAAAMMSLCALILWTTATPMWVAVFASTCMAVVLWWLWQRPEPHQR